MGAGPSAEGHAPGVSGRLRLMLAPAWGPRCPMPVLRSRGPRLHGLPGARSSHCELRPCGISRRFAPALPTVQTARPPRDVFPLTIPHGMTPGSRHGSFLPLAAALLYSRIGFSRPVPQEISPMPTRRPPFAACALLLAAALATLPALGQKKSKAKPASDTVRAAGGDLAAGITTPKEFFGFNVGDDYQEVNYTKAEAYWKKLATESNRMKMVDIGQT